jgi:hypothetical protein
MICGQPILIHYSKSNLMPDPKWRDRQGTIKAISTPGRHPRNVLVKTDIGMVVVPFWNVREIKQDLQLSLFGEVI